MWSKVLAIVLLLVAWALVFPRGGPSSLIAVVLSVVVVVIVAYVVADDRDRGWVVAIALLAVVARDALVGLIDLALLSQGTFWYAPDEQVYVGRAARIYQYWLDPAIAFDHSDPYVRSWQVHGMARLYQLVGGENIVVVKVVNTTLAVIAALLAYRAMRNLAVGGSRWALALFLIYPSLMFWSALTLKDSYVIFFLISSLWATTEYLRSRRLLWLAVAVAVLVPLESVRMYMFVTGALALLFVPLALARWKERIGVGAGLLVTVYVLMAVIQPFKDLGANVLYIPIVLRGAAAQGARTAFVTPAPVKGEPGDRIVVAVTGVTPPPDFSPRTVVVPPGTEIVVQHSTPIPAASSNPGASVAPAGSTPAILRPGDIIVIAGRAPSSAATSGPASPTSPTPSASPRTVFIQPDVKSSVGLASEVDPDAVSFGSSLQTNIRHLPVGILYTLFAPFPWTARTLEQFATIPEMLLWYVCLAAALYAMVTMLWRRDLRFAHGLAMIAGLVLVLSLIGANVGTLIRSRAMLIPYVLILAGVGISLLFQRYPQLSARWDEFVATRRGQPPSAGAA